jgi:hypothetical protein
MEPVYIKRYVNVESFCSESKREFAKLNMESIVELASILEDLSSEHSFDTVRIGSYSDNDATSIRQLLETNLSEIKNALESFAAECEILVKTWLPYDAVAFESAIVAELLHRLEHDILPNIVPDSSLLGKRAPFPAILIASALYRLQLLVRGNLNSPQDISRQIDLVERLTAKALEVTYVQHEYSKWLGDKVDERTE